MSEENEKTFVEIMITIQIEREFLKKANASDLHFMVGEMAKVKAQDALVKTMMEEDLKNDTTGTATSDTG